MTEGKSKRGFAAMDPKLVSEIARKGGKAGHAKGTAHTFTPEEAREAGRKGGRTTHERKRAAMAAEFNQEAKEASDAVSEKTDHSN